MKLKGSGAQVQVRRATEADARAIAEVHVASWRGAYRGIIPDSILSGLSVERRAQGWINLLRDGDVDAFVALDDAGSVVGFASVQRSRDTDGLEGVEEPAVGEHAVGQQAAGQQAVGKFAIGKPVVGELTTLYVLPAQWRRGCGRALMDAVRERARERSFASLTLWVLENNPRARRFYEAVGFAPDGARKSETLREGVVLHEVRYRMEIARPRDVPGETPRATRRPTGGSGEAGVTDAGGA